MPALMHLLSHHRQQTRSYSVLGVGAGARDACVITLLKSPWHIQPCILWVSASYGGRSSGPIRCSSSSVWRKPSVSTNFRSKNTLPASAKASKQAAKVSGASKRKQSATNASEAIDLLKNRLQQGIAIDSYSCVEILKRCLKQEDLPAVKQVHECAIESGMQQNIYVATNLLSGYIRCGRLEDACRVFDELAKKDVVTWNVMIGGYAQHSCVKDAMEVFHRMRKEGMQPNAVTYLSILKACASPSALKWVEEVHAYIREGGFESDVRVGTSLLKMYAKCGNVEEARNTFDKLARRDVITWTAMIGAHADSGDGEEAYRLLLQMKQEGLKPDAFTYASILNACSSAGALEWVREAHSHAREAGYASDVRVGTALVHMYAKCGSIDEARLAFDKMEERDVITWNVMIGGLAQHGCGSEAYRLLLQMKREGFKPNAITYMSILNECSSAGALEWVREVHSHAREAGYESDVRVGNALVHMYAKCGSINDARPAFDKMEERDVITWNVMIGALAQHGCGSEAYRLLLRMKREGFKPNAITYMSILNVCSSSGALEWVREVHSHAREAGFESDVRVGNALVHMYAKCGSIDEARLAFDKMEERDVITWNVMIGGLAQHGCGSEAYRLLLQMRREGLKPDAFTYASILNACASAGALEWVREVHSYAREAGFESDVRVGNALVHMYAKCGSIDEARLAFDKMEERDVITWNVMIGGLAQHGCGSEAYRLLLQMRREGLKPDAFTYSSILNACASAGGLEWVREVHSHAREAGYESDVRVGNALVHMYAKCGSIDDARLAFDMMEERDVITWNVMIGRLAEHGCGSEAYRLLLQMKREGLKPDAFTYASILNACASAGALEWVREVHRHAREAGFESDVRVGNALVHMYAKCGSIDEARLAFEKMEERDVITWNVLIGGLAQHGCGSEAYRLLLQMKREGFKPNAITYMSILNECASAGALEWVREVHGHAREAGFESDVRVGNALVHMYAKCGSIDDARLAFDKMEERDVITWNVMIGGLAQHGCGSEAYRFLLQMKQEGLKPNAITYMSILNECSSSGALEWVREVHSHAREAGFESDVRVGNALVHMYAKCGSIDDARLAFDKMEERDVITWNVMIGALAQHGCGSEAYRFLLQMRREGLKPDAFTYASILNACASAGALEWVREVHSHAREAGFESDVRVGNALVHMYAKCGSIDEARLAFDKMEERDVVTWNVMIGGLAQHGCGSEAYRLLLRMKREGFKANAITYMSILNECSSSGALEWVREVHSHSREAGFESDVRVGNALVHMYAECGSIDEARLAFDKMEERDVITWNVMIGGLAQHGCGSEAYRFLLQMKREGLKPDAFTYASILNACASAGALEWVREVHSYAREAGFESDVRVGNALVHMYAKCGSIDEARLAFDKMEERDVVTWNVMIGGLAEHGCGHEALEVFKTMLADGVKPNEISFVVVLSACSHSGLVDESRRHFLAMTQDYGIEPSVVLCNCMVDVLARAGHLEEAMLLIINMPVEPNGSTWGALLGGCRTYGNVELGKLAGNERLKLEPKDASAYVLLSNIYAAAGKWEEVLWVRTMMQERGIRKEPGRSWIEVDNKVHDFVVGDTSHSEAKEIYAELRRLSETIKAEGYIPDTRLVLRNIDEEEKELALCSHSEKLAIAYGLMRTPLGQPIRVFKNLRVCSDCHTATKFISKVTERDIVVRMLIAFTTSKMACVLVVITGDQVGNLDQLLAILFFECLDHDFCMQL